MYSIVTLVRSMEWIFNTRINGQSKTAENLDEVHKIMRLGVLQSYCIVTKNLPLLK